MLNDLLRRSGLQLMGNTLCKEPGANSSLRPGRVLDNFGSLMCPNGLGKSKTGINKTYLSRHV
ncbi:hypothetical protein pipiens_018039, partial [Culex pipiens pipiens]